MFPYCRCVGFSWVTFDRFVLERMDHSLFIGAALFSAMISHSSISELRAYSPHRQSITHAVGALDSRRWLSTDSFPRKSKLLQRLRCRLESDSEAGDPSSCRCKRGITTIRNCDQAQCKRRRSREQGRARIVDRPWTSVQYKHGHWAVPFLCYSALNSKSMNHNYIPHVGTSRGPNLLGPKLVTSA